MRILDEGKVKLLGEDIERHAARPTNVPDDAWLAYLTASYLLGQIEWEAAHGQANYDRLAQNAQRLRSAFTEAIERVREFDEGFLRLPALEIIGRWLTDTDAAVVTFCCTEFGSFGLVMRNNNGMAIKSVEVPNLKREEIKRLIFDDVDDEGTPRRGWLGAMVPYIKDRQSGNLEGWVDQIPTTLQLIGKKLLAPIISAVGSDVKRLIIVPSHELYVLPLHAAPIASRPPKLLIDQYEFTFTPSLEFFAHSILHSQGKNMNNSLSVLTTAQESVEELSDQLLVVTNPELDTALGFAEYEGLAAVKCLGSAKILHGAQAKREDVVRSFGKATAAHFACHATFNWANARKSGLSLADGPLTVEELLLGEITLGKEVKDDHVNYVCVPLELSRMRLVTISACETGVTNVVRGSPSEYLAIASEFLLAGVPTVISTLWAVPDLSTALFMEQVYSQLGQGASVAGAVRSAAQWLKSVTARELLELGASRNESRPFATIVPAELRSESWRRFLAMDEGEVPYAHPYYWAGFVATGHAGSVF
jgi:CHAT domain-containing protein